MELMLQIAAYVEVGLCWLAWMLAFAKPRKEAAGQKEAASAPASRLGIFLVMVGFMLTWVYVRPVGFHKSAAALVASMILVALMNWVRLPAQAPLFLRHSTRCFRMFSHQPDPPGPQWSAVQQALRVPRVILFCSLSQLIALSLRLHCCRFMRTNWTRVGENLPNLLRIKRLRRSASCGQMRTMGDHRGPGRF